MRHREHAAFVGFQGDPLREHHIASDEVALRNEAPFADTLFSSHATKGDLEISISFNRSM